MVDFHVTFPKAFQIMPPHSFCACCVKLWNSQSERERFNFKFGMLPMIPEVVHFLERNLAIPAKYKREFEYFHLTNISFSALQRIIFCVNNDTLPYLCPLDLLFWTDTTVSQSLKRKQSDRFSANTKNRKLISFAMKEFQSISRMANRQI